MEVSTPQPARETLLSKRQFGEKLGCTTRTIDRWLEQGVLPAGIKVQIGGTVRFRESVADRWIADGCREAAQ